MKVRYYIAVSMMFGLCICLNAMDKKVVRVYRNKPEVKKSSDLQVGNFGNPPGGPDVSAQEWVVIPLVSAHKEILQKYQDAKSPEDAQLFLAEYTDLINNASSQDDQDTLRRDLGEAQAIRARRLMARHEAQLTELSALLASKALDKGDQDSLRTALIEQLDYGKQGLQRRCASCCGFCSCR